MRQLDTYRTSKLYHSLNVGSLILIVGVVLNTISEAVAYDVNKAVAYAETWWNGRNSNYIDYGDYDCANFVSQCLIAGGLMPTGVATDRKGSVINCDELNKWLVNQLDVYHETWTRSQVMNQQQREPIWFDPGDVAIFGNSQDPWMHAVFCVSGDEYDWARCNAHSQDVRHVYIRTFFAYNPQFDRVTFYNVSAASGIVSAKIISYSPSSLITVNPGESFTLKVRIRNTGDTGANFYGGVSVWGSQGNEIIDEWSSRFYLSPGQEKEVSWSRSINQPGEYYVQFGAWDESRTKLYDKKPSPSQMLVKVRIGDGGNFSAEILDIWVEPSDVIPGDSADVYASIKNTSDPNGPYGGYATFDMRRIITSPNNEKTTFYRDGWEFEPYEEKKTKANYTFSEAGTYHIKVEVWQSNGYETDWDPSESTLFASKEASITVSGPQLTISSISPREIRTGESTYRAELTLQGSGFTEVERIKFKWDGPDSRTDEWSRGSSAWNNYVDIISDNTMVIRPVVLSNETAPANWTWTVTLYDDFGHAASGQFTVYYEPEDTQAPSVSIASPADGATVQSSAITVRGTAADPGEPSSGVDYVEVRVNGGSWRRATGTGSWSISVNLSSGFNNRIEARCVDNAGNVSSIKSITVKPGPVHPPSLSITSPADGATVGSSPVTVRGTASSPSSGVNRVEVRVNGGGWLRASGTGSWSMSVGLRLGSNRIEARCVDNAGNVSSIKSITVEYEPRAAVQILSVQKVDAQTIELRVAFRIGATGVTYQIVVDEAPTLGQPEWEKARILDFRPDQITHDQVIYIIDVPANRKQAFYRVGIIFF